MLCDHAIIVNQVNANKSLETIRARLKVGNNIFKII